MSKCQVCKGTGFVIYSKAVGARQIEYIAKCVCSKGGRWAYEGDEYRVPTISEVEARGEAEAVQHG